YTTLQACDKALASPWIFVSPSIVDLPSAKDSLSKLKIVYHKLQNVHRCRVIEHVEEAFKTLDTIKERFGETNSERRERITQVAKNGALRLAEAPTRVPIIAWKRAVFFLIIGNLLILENQDQPDPLKIRQAERLLR